jgi:hypothetical protein
MGSKSALLDWLFDIKNCENFDPFKFSFPRTVIFRVVSAGSPKSFIETKEI